MVFRRILYRIDRCKHECLWYKLKVSLLAFPEKNALNLRKSMKIMESFDVCYIRMAIIEDNVKMILCDGKKVLWKNTCPLIDIALDVNNLLY